MDRHELSDPNRKVLRRIVLLLLALADLAERASIRSAFMRWSVLWLLLPGEVVARDYVAALTHDARVAGPVAGTDTRLARDSAADAIRLAASFRMLAALLVAFLEELVAAMQVEVEGARWAASTRPPARGRARVWTGTCPVERRDSS